jgi:hypothetical protein
MNEDDVSYFYLVYSCNRRLEIRFPSFRSTPLIAVRGSKAVRIYETLKNILDVYRLAKVIKKGSDLILELPPAVGFSVVIYILASYNVPYYNKYIFVVEQMSKGELPISKHLTKFIELAIDLSMYMNVEAKSQIVSRKAALLTAKALRVLLNGLMPSQRKIAPATPS